MMSKLPNVLFKYAVLGLIWFPGGLTPLSAAGEKPPEYRTGPYSTQGLDAFMERHGEKPYDLFLLEDGSLSMHRVIFNDKQFGTEVWMIDDSPTVDHAGTASVWSAWNVNASTLFLEGIRPIEGIPHEGWFTNADFSKLQPSPHKAEVFANDPWTNRIRLAVWAPENPDVYYAPISPIFNVTRNNFRTGEQEILAEWEPLYWPESTPRIYGLTRDKQYIFVDLPNRGIWVPFTHDSDYPIHRLNLYDGRPVGPDGQRLTHRESGRNTTCVLYENKEFGELIALRTGVLIDRETGEKSPIAAPLCGNMNYLRAFHEDRVNYPQGKSG